MLLRLCVDRHATIVRVTCLYGVACLTARPHLLIRRVLCLDVVGRGRSSALTDPSGYSYPQYVSDAVAAFHGGFGLTEVHWIGTSMGGILGMIIAASGLPLTIRRLVLNDVGPFVPKAAIERIGTYVGLAPVSSNAACPLYFTRV